ncbi:hypothetical protein [Chryseobacterium balustinum]|nr:hypothetical protein [Chryseobacterium balustinum]
MNNIIEQYLTYNYDVVIVDTGDSYSGTANTKEDTSNTQKKDQSR